MTVRTKRTLALLALPYVMALVAVWMGLVVLSPEGPRLEAREAASRLFVLLAGTVIVAWMVCARDRAVRLLGHVAYALALALAFGWGVVLAFMGSVGGFEGGTPDPRWVTVVLGGGAALSALCILAVLALMLADIHTAD